MTYYGRGPTGPVTSYRCPRCLEMLFERPENGTVGCKSCPNQNYFVPVVFEGRQDRKPSLLTVCCRKPITDFSQLNYSCPDHAFRHILPLDVLEPQVRAMAESPAVKQQLARQDGRFLRGLLIALLCFAAVVALTLILK